MGTFIEVKGLDKEKLGLYTEQEEIFLYSPEQCSSYVYMRCDACEVELACRPEDLKYFLKEIKDMKCPDCGESALEYFRLDVKVKYLIPALADLN